ncbi:MAG: glycosyltransferase [Chitinivibrionales bacterium]|nr:glycosyltransferase [Chitinivibrionales bacterium]
MPVVFAVTVTLLLWCTGVYLLWKIPLCSGKRNDADISGCTIIIPARNEESSLPRLLDSLNNQRGARDEILVVNDRSTDETAAVARRHGARVFDNSERPEGWTGKTWACWNGAQEARNDILLFIDADTWLAPAALEKIVATYRRHGGLVTLQPYHCMEKAWERLSALFNLMVMIGVDAFAFGRGRRGASGSFGPCIICSKHDYFAAGGHERVKGKVLENLALGPVFKEAGMKITCFGGEQTIFFRMYPEGTASLVEGWTKGFATGAAETPRHSMACTVAWISGAFTAAILNGAAIGMPALRTPAVAALYPLYAGQLYWMLRRTGNFGIVTCLLFPVHLLFFAFIYIKSFIAIFVTKKVRWKGRTISVNT